MKKIIISAVFILAFGFYVYTQKVNVPAVTPEAKPEQPDTTPAKSDTADVPLPTNPSPETTASAGQYKDGEYTGTKVDAYYGNVQVKAIIAGGKITDVQFLETPTQPENSITVNKMAKPILAQEAIKIQSAEVDGATGATFTSKAFKESLAAALALAKK